MSGVGRYVRMHAKPGQGEALATLLLEVAEDLRDAPGCELYAINRSASDPDVIWVTEQWQNQELLDSSLDRARDRIPAAMELVRDGGFERIDVELLGGVGHPPADAAFSIVNLDEVEDMAPRFGLGETGEARFARTALGAVAIGLSLQRLRPGARQTFGHRHLLDEEIYLVLRGSGRVAIDDEIRGVRPLDAIRVGPGAMRVFEAGDEGLEVLAVGTHHAGDAQMEPGYWPG
jgi:quinol monooxygenase YgiN